MANEFKVKNGLIAPNAILEGSTSGSTTLQASSAASGTITLPASTGTIALTNNKLSVFAATTSAELASVISDETGTGNLVLSASPTFTGTISAANLTLSGNLTVNGTTTTINSTTVSVDDKNIVLADVASPSDATSDGGGITLKGTTDKTFNWLDATDAWTSSEHLNLLTGKSYYINGVAVLNSTSLGSGVTSSSLTTLGTIATGTWQASLISSTYGGTGVNNSGRTLTINSGNLTFTADAAGSSVTVPSSGTLSTLAGSETLTNKTLTTPIISSISNTGTITLPTSTDTLVGRATTDTLSNKTHTTPKINDASSDHTYNFASSELADNRTITLPLLTGNDTFVFEAHTQTLTNKTLTSPTVSGLYLSDSSIVFEGSSPDGFETTLTVTDPTADQTITLPNATTTLVGINTTDTLTNKTLTSPDINAGTVDSITSLSLRDTSAAFDVTITSASSTALTAARTLTLDLVNANRSVKLAGNIDLAANLITSGGHSVTFNTTGATSLTLPTSGTIITQDSLNTPTLTTPKINDTSSNHTYNFTVNELTDNRNITLPLLTGNDTFVFEAHTQTLTNKTLTSPTVSGLYLSDSSIVFEGSSADDNETTLTVTNPTADRTITFPDRTGTVITSGDTDTVTATMLASDSVTTVKILDANVTNAKLANSSITINGSAVSLGGSVSNLALTTGKLSQFAATTSSELAGVISDETGTGSLVFSASPTFTGTVNAAAITISGNVVVGGDLTVNGTTTTINSTTLAVDDKNLELGSVSTLTITGSITATTTTTTVTGITTTSGLIPGMVLAKTSGAGAFGGATTITSIDSATQITITSTTANTVGSITFTASGPSASTANGGGITLKGDTDKTIIWDSANTNWTSSEHWNLPTGKEFKINNTTVLTSTQVLGKSLPAGTILGTSDTQTLTNKSLSDSTTYFIDDADSTKKMQFELSSIATATTRTLTVPNVNGTIVTTGDTGTVTSTMIADGTIVNTDINASAAIAYSKLSLTGAIVNGDLAGSIAAGKLTLTSANIIVGNGSNVGAAVAMSGDITIDNAGATAIGAGKVTNAMLAGSIALSKLTSDTSTALGVGTLELGHASDTTLSRSSAGVLAVEGVVVPTVSSTNTLTNKTLTSPTLSLPKFDISAAVSAAGSNQGTATALTTMINNVTTVAASTGVALPTAVAGYIVIVRNGGANTLNVYPATGASINAGAVDSAHSLPVGAMIQYVATSTTQWYTMSSTFA